MLSGAQKGILSADITSYPGYTGDANAIRGTVNVTQKNVSALTVTYDLYDALPVDSGGLHIHENKTCDDAGDHYYRPNGKNSTDPWSSDVATYSSDENGHASGSFDIASGYPYLENFEHAFVIHDGNGTEIGCGLLTPLAFGIHVHTGTTCDDADLVYNSYWTPEEDPDPWDNITYIPDGYGNATGWFTVDSGYSCTENEGHAFLVHGQENERLGCGTLESELQDLNVNMKAFMVSPPLSDSPLEEGDDDNNEGLSGVMIALTLIGLITGLMVLVGARYIYIKNYSANKEEYKNLETKSSYSTFGHRQ